MVGYPYTINNILTLHIHFHIHYSIAINQYTVTAFVMGVGDSVSRHFIKEFLFAGSRQG